MCMYYVNKSDFCIVPQASLNGKRWAFENRIVEYAQKGRYKNRYSNPEKEGHHHDHLPQQSQLPLQRK